jgi:hypothetical protein
VSSSFFLTYRRRFRQVIFRPPGKQAPKYRKNVGAFDLEDDFCALIATSFSLGQYEVHIKGRDAMADHGSVWYERRIQISRAARAKSRHKSTQSKPESMPLSLCRLCHAVLRNHDNHDHIP